jgi:transcriptional regulator with XRE-family HTH domain
MSLRAFLDRHELSQKELAEAVSLSEATVSRIINGENDPRKENIDALLRFCRTIEPTISYDELFGSPGLPPAANE